MNKMQNISITIEANKDFDSNTVDAISGLISNKLGVNVQKTDVKINEMLKGGVIVTAGEYKFVLPSDLGPSTNELTLIIESSRELTENERQKYLVYAHREFPSSKDSRVSYIINEKIIAGVRVRYGDEEIDLTLDKILDKAFSKI